VQLAAEHAGRGLGAQCVLGKMGVPVKPNWQNFLNFFFRFFWASPNWLRWHSSKMNTTCLP
jgi:hypothetical protein